MAVRDRVLALLLRGGEVGLLPQGLHAARLGGGLEHVDGAVGGGTRAESMLILDSAAEGASEALRGAGEWGWAPVLDWVCLWKSGGTLSVSVDGREVKLVLRLRVMARAEMWVAGGGTGSSSSTGSLYVSRPGRGGSFLFESISGFDVMVVVTTWETEMSFRKSERSLALRWRRIPQFLQPGGAYCPAADGAREGSRLRDRLLDLLRTKFFRPFAMLRMFPPDLLTNGLEDSI